MALHKALALGLVLLLLPATAHAQNDDWAFVPSFGINTGMFWGQFWSVVTWMQPFIFPVLGLSIGTAVLTYVVKRAFFTGGA